jgi:hypothetical protein
LTILSGLSSGSPRLFSPPAAPFEGALGFPIARNFRLCRLAGLRVSSNSAPSSVAGD